MTKETKKTTKKNPLIEEEVVEETVVEAVEETVEAKVEATPTPKVEVKPSVDQEMRSDLEKTKAKLSKEKMVTFMAPLEQGEKAGATINVFINGHKTIVKKGVMVEVSESVANILANHFNVALNAGADFLIDENDRKADALN